MPADVRDQVDCHHLTFHLHSHIFVADAEQCLAALFFIVVAAG